MRRRARVMAVVGSMGALALAGAAMMPEPSSAELAPVVRGPLVLTVEAIGRTRVKQRYAVLSPVTGNLLRIGLRPGERVEAGAELARVAPGAASPLDARSRAEAKARVAQAASAEGVARALLERALVGQAQASRELERARELAGRGSSAAQALEGAQFEVRAQEQEVLAAERTVERARAELEAVRAALASVGEAGGPEVVVRAPAGGRVLKVLRESAGPIAAGAPLFEIGEPSELEAVLEVLTTQATKIAPGAEVEFLHWGGGEPLGGRVAYVEPSAFTKVSALGVEEQRVNVVVEPRGPGAWSGLADGYHVEARVVVARREGALKTPAAALVRQGTGWAVFVVDGEGRVRRRGIRIGAIGEGEAEILEGLSDGERVIVHPSDQTAEGARVRGG